MAERQDMAVLALSIVSLLSIISTTTSQILEPPYFNLAYGKEILASSTCGEGVTEPELFCKLTGADSASQGLLGNYEVIQGQLCDYCVPGHPSQAHPASQALDGKESWWQSPPLSRGLEYDKVNLTIDLGQEFHVAYVFIKMANSPRPGVFALEKSADYGETWQPWQYFADTPSDCRAFFGDNYEDSIRHDDSVICTTEYSKVVPLEGGEIVLSLVNNRPSANNFSLSDSLQSWTKATNVRLRLLRTKTLLGHLISVYTGQDPTVTRRYFYSIKDISIGGRCVCNGHAESCDLTDPYDQTRLLCRCQHNTCGAQCETCCPNFIQKPWQPAQFKSQFFECEPCQCYGHTTECIYDEEVAANGESIDIHGEYVGGGVCQNCQHFTEGINCEKCIFGYYRPEGQPLDSPYACTRCNCDLIYSTGDCEDTTGRCICKPQFTGPFCQQCAAGYYDPPNCYPCTCNVNGTEGEYCGEGLGGQCPCKPNFAGRTCDRCDYGFYGFPNCQPCACDNVGALDVNFCDPWDGQCRCNPNFGGRNCGECAKGYYAYPQCRGCDCDLTGTTEDICDQYNGLCQCKPGFGGPRCDRCEVGYYRYPNCMECGCNEVGSASNECDANGQCFCNQGFGGRLCDQCEIGYYRYPECLQCNCDYYGSMPGQTCDQENGQCICRPTFDGLTCNKCRPNYYNYPMCEECNCNPAGAMEVPGHPLGGCGGRITGQLCECKDRVEGRICDVCKHGYWNLDINNALGCEDCSCYRPGTVGGNNICSQETGQCACKPFTSGRRCDVCVDGTYSLQENNVFGCMDCGCDIGGSISQICDKSSGECTCRLRVRGVKCDQPLDVHYYPSLHQHQFEAEDGRTVRGGAIRYGFDEDIFPNYSWRGYAILSDIQDTVVLDIDIKKSSLYRIIIRYVSRNSAPISAEVTFTPELAADVTQTSTVLFPSNYDPEFVADIATFVLNPGPWSIAIKSVETLYVDYVVLVPQTYYEATHLSKQIHHNPCTVPATDNVCKHFVYVDISAYPIAHGEDGWTSDFRDELAQLYPDDSINAELGTTNMAYLDENQRDLYLELNIPNPGPYVLVIQYHSHDVDHSQTIDVELIPEEGDTSFSSVVLPGCPYSSLCRQVVTDSDGNPMAFEIPGASVGMYILGYDDVDLAVDSVIAIPLDEWTFQFISPQLKCIRMDKQCLETEFETVSGTIRVEVEEGPNEENVATDMPPHIIDTSVRVIKMDGTLPTLTVKGSVSSPGPHVFIVHYYQPYHVGFEVPVNITVDTSTNQGRFNAEYCPSVSGCRALVVFDDLVGETSVQVNNYDYVLSFENPSQNPLWLDYVNVIPEGTYTTKVLDVKPIDLASVFVKKCTYDDYYVEPDTTGFCANSIFSLTTNENNGAIPCDCNDRGSLKFNCDKFGGQCECRPHVIGRDCSRCRTGYFGFPNCRRCNCPSGLCDPDSGQCVCPPNVGGDNCDTCFPQTFGFDPIIGCEECNCNPRGVDNNQMECDFNTGQCSCKPNVGGRQCDKCLAGYYQFPDCQPCACDLHGSEPDVCDQNTAQCLCKENVVGPQCSQCRESTFYLEDRNKKGCTQCFCFGSTQRCRSSNYIQTQVREMRGWGMTNLLVPEFDYDAGQSTLTSYIETSNVDDPDQAIYWVAPEPYLGNKITSYGGQLVYGVTFTLPFGVDSSGLIKQDIRIEGNGFSLVRIMPEQPSEGKRLEVEVDMFESMFVHELSGASVSREQFMTLLANVESLQIRASYFTVVDMVSLHDVTLDVAIPDDGGFGQLARNVEQCECPVAYQGTSCEECAPGFYRLNQLCVPCQCNGRADVCDPVSGECTNCRDNFGGPQCEVCKQGYYYDDYFGRCESCACPYTVEEDNHASTCVVYNGVVERCICLPGYTGDRCDSCEPGHYGDPILPGGTCTPCSGGCNDNINPSNPSSCDMVTGACLKCINNAGGDHCEICKEWHWGDAIDRKDCQMCDCNVTGSDLCDDRTGSCLCKSHVEGIHCDRCEPGAFGFESGNGCQECDCSEGAQGSACDIVNGQCACQQGTTGRRCDQCQPGYWDWGPFGCTKCKCDYEGAVTCDSITGACQCLPGVTGPRCDQCEERWILIEGYGCQECDSCVHRLLDDVDAMESNVTYIMEDLDSVSVGVGAIKRLDKIEAQVINYRPQVDDLFISGGFDDSVLDPIKADLQDVEGKTQKAVDLSERLARESEVMVSDALDVLEDTEGLNDAVRGGVEKSREAVRYAEEVLQDILTSIDTVNVDRLIADAETALEEMQRRDFSVEDLVAKDELDKALDQLAEAQAQLDTAMEQSDEVDALKDHMKDIEMKLIDLMNSSRHSLDLSQTAVDLNADNQRASTSIKEDSEMITQSQEDSKMMLDMAEDLLDQAHSFLEDASAAYVTVNEDSTLLDSAMDQLRESVDDLRIEDELHREVNRSLDHAYNLQRQAKDLDNLLADTRESAEGALGASKAYQDIVDAINLANRTAFEASKAAGDALQSSQGISDDSRDSYERSVELRDNADITKDSVQIRLHPRLDEAIRAADVVENINQQAEDGLTDFLLGIKTVPEGVSDRAQQAAAQAMDAQTKAEGAAKKVENIVQELPEDQRRSDQIATDIEEANSDIRRADKQVQNVLDLVPEANDLLTRLSEKADHVNRIGNDLTESINKLKDNIAISREEASRIRLGQKFYLNTTLQIRNPSNLVQAGSYTKLSMFFKTGQSDGFLAYIGPDRTSGRVQTDDHVALEVVDGKLNFKFYLGDMSAGPAIIVNDKVVSDNEWHEVIVERTGKVATVIVRTEEEEDSVATGQVQGTFSVLDLNPATTKFYIGGVPDSAGLDDKLDSLHFIGCIEDVKFDGIPIGLWNFIQGENNHHGCVSRDKLIGSQSNGFRFDGNGAVVIETTYTFKPKVRSLIALKFKTFAENGLMFLLHGEQDFLSIEMKNGRVLLQYDLGSGTAELMSAESYNDGQWHNIIANRLNADGLLKVDNATAANGRSPGDKKDLDVITSGIYIGGFYPGMHEFERVTHQGFEGCIKDVALAGTTKDLNNNVFAKGVTPGCPQVSRIISFSVDEENSYLAMDPVNVDRNFESTLKMKTQNANGLIYYVASDDQLNSLAVALINGRIVVTANSRGSIERLETNTATYNDGSWHYVTVTKVGEEMQLDIDDHEMVKMSLTRRRIPTSSPFYFGGVPAGYALSESNVGTTERFVGCVGDVTVNGGFINFALAPASAHDGASLGRCGIPDPTTSFSTMPTLMPIVPNTGEPEPTDTCMLPLEPSDTGDGSPEDAGATRFGLNRNSRYEYESLPEKFRIVKEAAAGEADASNPFVLVEDESNFTMEFKTTELNGVLFYMADNRQVDFVALYLADGQVTYGFNCGSGAAQLTSPYQYNDGEWHTVDFRRKENRGELHIDGIEVAEGQSVGQTRSINVAQPYYLGGLSPDVAEKAAGNLQGITNSFVGCIRNMKLKGHEFDEPDREFFVEPCSTALEPGSFMYSDGGYIKAIDNFKVGLDLEISMEIKPRTMNGVLFSVTTTRTDYLALQLKDGKVIFNVNNGNGEFLTEYDPPSANELCDGQWHNIKAVKSKNVVTLYVDSVFTYPGLGAVGISSTDTNDPVYIGGRPDEHQSIKTTEQYVGCIRNIRLKHSDEYIDILLSEGEASGHVRLSGCPIG